MHKFIAEGVKIPVSMPKLVYLGLPPNKKAGYLRKKVQRGKKCGSCSKNLVGGKG